MNLGTSFRIIQRAANQWGENKDSTFGAALAYYMLFSIAPLLIICIRLAGAIFGEEAARGRVVEHLNEAMGQESAAAIQSLIEHAAKPGAADLASALSLLIAVAGALGVFLHVRSALCMIWRLKPPQGSTVLKIVLDYGLALAMVPLTGVLLLASLAASTFLPMLQAVLEESIPGTGYSVKVLEFAISFVYLPLLFGLMFRVLSGQRIAWGYVWYGAIVSSLLFIAGKVALGLYFTYTSTASMYGAAGSVVVFLVWVYYSSQIVFFGAELVQARRTRHEWLSNAES